MAEWQDWQDGRIGKMAGLARWQDWQDGKMEAMAQPFKHETGLLELPGLFLSQDSLLLRLLQQTHHCANQQLVPFAANR